MTIRLPSLRRALPLDCGKLQDSGLERLSYYPFHCSVNRPTGQRVPSAREQDVVPLPDCPGGNHQDRLAWIDVPGEREDLTLTDRSVPRECCSLRHYPRTSTFQVDRGELGLWPPLKEKPVPEIAFAVTSPITITPGIRYGAGLSFPRLPVSKIWVR